jgi:hypothetical protein
MGGYCHYYGGAVIDVTSYSLDLSRRYERQIGEAARRRLGNLVEMPANWPYARELRLTGDDFLAALRAGDRGKMRELLEDTGARDDAMYLLFDQKDSPFAQLRTGAPVPMALFVSRASALQFRAGREVDVPFPAGTACYCRSPGCRHRWPISSNDADVWKTRPYVCVFIRKQDWPGGKIIVELRRTDGRWLKEPAKTAFLAR